MRSDSITNYESINDESFFCHFERKLECAVRSPAYGSAALRFKFDNRKGRNGDARIARYSLKNSFDVVYAPLYSLCHAECTDLAFAPGFSDSLRLCEQ